MSKDGVEWLDEEAKVLLISAAVREMVSPAFRRGVLLAESGIPSEGAEELRKPLRYLWVVWLLQDSPEGEARLLSLLGRSELGSEGKGMLEVKRAILNAFFTPPRRGDFLEWRQADLKVLARLALESVAGSRAFFAAEDGLCPLTARLAAEEDLNVFQVIGAASVHERVVLWWNRRLSCELVAAIFCKVAEEQGRGGSGRRRRWDWENVSSFGKPRG